MASVCGSPSSIPDQSAYGFWRRMWRFKGGGVLFQYFPCQCHPNNASMHVIYSSNNWDNNFATSLNSIPLPLLYFCLYTQCFIFFLPLGLLKCNLSSNEEQNSVCLYLNMRVYVVCVYTCMHVCVYVWTLNGWIWALILYFSETDPPGHGGITFTKLV